MQLLSGHAKAVTCNPPVRPRLSCTCSDLFEGAAELRMLLCREQTNNGKRTVHVVTACGIFVQHILDAAPIDKYFEMFKPGSGSEGGFVRLKMRLLSGPDARKTKGAYSVFMCSDVCVQSVAPVWLLAPASDYRCLAFSWQPCSISVKSFSIHMHTLMWLRSWDPGQQEQVGMVWFWLVRSWQQT